MNGRRGSTLVESSVIMLLFLVILGAVLDAAQILFLHQLLNQRVRAGARYAAVHADDASGIQNVVAYNSTASDHKGPGFFGLTAAMVQVTRYSAGTAADRVEIRIAGYPMRFLSPWLAGTFTPGPFRAVAPTETAGAAQ